MAGLAIFGPPIMLQVPTQTDILQSYASHVCNQKIAITYVLSDHDYVIFKDFTVPIFVEIFS